MTKKLAIFCYLCLFSVLVVTGCDEKETDYSEVATIKRDQCAPMDLVTCYRDSETNEECFGSELCLYAEYKNERLTINEALNQKLITFDDVKTAYRAFIDELSPGN